MFYLDMRYASIIVIGHEGILQFLPLFREFRDAIEVYCQKDQLYFHHHGNAVLVPALNELPFSNCGFIDDTIDPNLVPFSSLAGDYEGAPHPLQYILAQESIYTGYKKLHENKIETLFFPNGLAPVLAQYLPGRMTRGMLNMSR